MYKLTPISATGSYVCTQSGEQTFVLKQNRWTMGKAQITCATQDELVIKKKSALSSVHLILKNGFEIGKITFDWKMTATIRVYHPNTLFILRKKGIIKPYFELICTNPKMSVLAFKGCMHWRKLSYGYNVELLTSDDDWFDMQELVMFAVYAINRRTAMSGNGG
ncbi:hypothetical protein [uncultured Microscilla sp.]|uniref:hypothetical protein n=1 Tax=uncultured Microscilla sp. TaxID=432653 RepID=UPI002603B2C4|nr:hypothetical protein [uncultured Microscilla sp.]